jgi:hypothetical protein
VFHLAVGEITGWSLWTRVQWFLDPAFSRRRTLVADRFHEFVRASLDAAFGDPAADQFTDSPSLAGLDAVDSPVQLSGVLWALIRSPAVVGHQPSAVSYRL